MHLTYNLTFSIIGEQFCAIATVVTKLRAALMNEFAIGQRWISETETELGLGIVVNLDFRLVTIFYPASDEERTYAKTNAPLSRIIFGPGKTIENTEGEIFLVTEVKEEKHLVTYVAHPLEDTSDIRHISESHLGFHIALNAVEDRLFSKQLDTNRWFEMRVAALEAKQLAENSPVLGLRGPRVDLIGHQLYIANNVAQRYAPRVLLADEVGLGKTIEAGLIIHQQLHTHRAKRVLIVVPKPLVHQWFVEMVRRFNLHFSIFDEERLASMQPEQGVKDMLAEMLAEELGQTSNKNNENPYLTQQLILCSTDFLLKANMEQLVNAEWDLVVIDEAHHLDWQEHEPSEAYQRAAKLAAASKGLLLLTATPEQLGIEAHFARLHLLDPARFSNLDAFKEEQHQYEHIAALVEQLQNQEPISDALLTELESFLPASQLAGMEKEQIIRELLDRSGTGRVLFRNTRQHIQGFPTRHLDAVSLDYPALYADLDDKRTRLLPESLLEDDSWCQHDPKVSWLTSFLKQHRQEKILIICARRETAMDLHSWLGYQQGMNVAVFHEHMDLISRDRAAAYFADPVDGAQALICSEIGSEGRNFQFAKHLVLFDLPRNPDLLEQRIGRLDRIGQGSDIYLHVPYFTEHAQETLFRWYNEGMQAFTRTNPAGLQVLDATLEPLIEAIQSPTDKALTDDLVDITRNAAAILLEQLDQGRDRLLELNSYHKDIAEELIEHLKAADANTPESFMQLAFERFGVDSEEHSEQVSILRPGSHMVTSFPHLPDEGLTVTTSRELALSRDHWHFLTWEHPMVTGAIDLALSENHGKASVALLKNKRIPAGTLLVEAFYQVSCQAPSYLQVERFLPTTVIRTLLNAKGQDMSQAVTHEQLSQQCRKADKSIARQVVDSQQALLEQLLKQNQQRLDKEAEQIKANALEKMTKYQEEEIQRLTALRAINPTVRPEEVEFLYSQTQALTEHLEQARCELAAIRVIVATEA